MITGIANRINAMESEILECQTQDRRSQTLELKFKTVRVPARLSPVEIH